MPQIGHSSESSKAASNGRGGRPSSSGGPIASVPAATIRKWLRDMMLIREFEIRCAQAYQQAKIGGFCHLYIGQEACAVGTLAAVNPDDPVVLAYRDHGHALARGMDPGACMAEMFGKSTGCAKGKGGSMHMFDKPHHLYGGHGIVGAQTPLGAGLAFAAKYEREVIKKKLHTGGTGVPPVGDGLPSKKVSLCYLGDGALNQGALHEAMNLAGLWSLPVIYIVENNRYSMGTSIERGTTMAHNLLAKSAAYGIEGLKIEEADGMDILRLYDRFKPYADECREQQKPGFVDLHTYRYQGHSMSDPQKYRTKDEVEKAKERDSIALLQKFLLGVGAGDGGTGVSPVGPGGSAHNAAAPDYSSHPAFGSLSEPDFLQMQKDIKAAVAAAVKFAEDSPIPDLAELYTDVYANPQPNLSPIREYTQGVKNPLL